MEIIRKADFFRKPRDDLERETVCGSCLSLLTAALISVLAALAISTIPPNFVEKQAKVTGTDTFENQLEVNIDWIFYNAPCTSFDVQKKDKTMLGFKTILNGMQYSRLSSQKNEVIPNTYVNPVIQQKYGNEDQPFKEFLTGLMDHEMCRVNGTFIVKKIPGLFGVGIGATKDQITRIKKLEPQLYSQFNLAHKITSLSFGPLEIQEKIIKEFGSKLINEFNSAGNTTYIESFPLSCSYYVKIIPHTYSWAGSDATEGETYLYSHLRECYVLLFIKTCIGR